MDADPTSSLPSPSVSTIFPANYVVYSDGRVCVPWPCPVLPHTRPAALFLGLDKIPTTRVPSATPLCVYYLWLSPLPLLSNVALPPFVPLLAGQGSYSIALLSLPRPLPLGSQSPVSWLPTPFPLLPSLGVCGCSPGLEMRQPDRGMQSHTCLSTMPLAPRSLDRLDPPPYMPVPLLRTGCPCPRSHFPPNLTAAHSQASAVPCPFHSTTICSLHI